jgi:hypothetical protein
MADDLKGVGVDDVRAAARCGAIGRIAAVQQGQSVKFVLLRAPARGSAA